MLFVHLNTYRKNKVGLVEQIFDLKESPAP